MLLGIWKHVAFNNDSVRNLVYRSIIKFNNFSWKILNKKIDIKHFFFNGTKIRFEQNKNNFSETNKMSYILGFPFQFVSVRISSVLWFHLVPSHLLNKSLARSSWRCFHPNVVTWHRDISPFKPVPHNYGIKIIH